jgi:hypothetical protein
VTRWTYPDFTQGARWARARRTRVAPRAAPICTKADSSFSYPHTLEVLGRTQFVSISRTPAPDGAGATTAANRGAWAQRAYTRAGFLGPPAAADRPSEAVAGRREGLEQPRRRLSTRSQGRRGGLSGPRGLRPDDRLEHVVTAFGHVRLKRLATGLHFRRYAANGSGAGLRLPGPSRVPGCRSDLRQMLPFCTRLSLPGKPQHVAAGYPHPGRPRPWILPAEAALLGKPRVMLGKTPAYVRRAASAGRAAQNYAALPSTPWPSTVEWLSRWFSRRCLGGFAGGSPTAWPAVHSAVGCSGWGEPVGSPGRPQRAALGVAAPV